MLFTVLCGIRGVDGIGGTGMGTPLGTGNGLEGKTCTSNPLHMGLNLPGDEFRDEQDCHQAP